jgi:hypothetical protein
MYDYKYPIERRVIEDRLFTLEREYSRFDYMINPYHIQPGLFLDLDITSIKRKKGTLNSMANVLNEFLHGISKGFADAAFAAFSRRRSTVRADLAQSFSSEPSDAPVAMSTVSVANSGDAAAESPLAIEAPKRGRKPAGAAEKPAQKAGAAGRRGRRPRAK